MYVLIKSLQNIDGLDKRAVELEDPTLLPRLFQYHGALDTVRCVGCHSQQSIEVVRDGWVHGQCVACGRCESTFELALATRDGSNRPPPRQSAHPSAPGLHGSLAGKSFLRTDVELYGEVFAPVESAKEAKNGSSNSHWKRHFLEGKVQRHRGINNVVVIGTSLNADVQDTASILRDLKGKKRRIFVNPCPPPASFPFTHWVKTTADDFGEAWSKAAGVS